MVFLCQIALQLYKYCGALLPKLEHRFSSHCRVCYKKLCSCESVRFFVPNCSCSYISTVEHCFLQWSIASLAAVESVVKSYVNVSRMC